MALVSFLFTDVAAQTPETQHVASADGCFFDQCEEESQAFVLLQTKARLAKKPVEIPGVVAEGHITSPARPISRWGRIAKHWEGAAANIAQHARNSVVDNGHLNKQPVSTRGRLAQHLASLAETVAEGAYSLMQAGAHYGDNLEDDVQNLEKSMENASNNANYGQVRIHSTANYAVTNIANYAEFQ